MAAWEGDDSLFTEKAASFSRYKLELHIPKEFFNRSLQEGRCLFFLDALDEVPESDRGAVMDKIEGLVEKHSTNRFLVTSRRAGYDDKPLPETEGFFNRYLVQPMEDEDITSFVNSRFDDDPEEAAQAMSILDGNPGIKALAANPLHLAIFNMLQGRSSGLPLNRAEFYKQAVDILIEDKDDAGRRIDNSRFEGHENLLTHIARLFHDENRETIGRAELEDRAADSLLEYREKSDNPTRADEDEAFAEAEAFIERAERRTGLLMEEHPGSGVFRFVHATFREYLTARDIHNRRRNYSRHREACWDEIKDHLTDARWREVILLLLGSLDDRYCTYLTEKILATGDEFIEADVTKLPTHLQLAAEALANQASMSSELQQEIVGRLVRVAKDKPSSFDYDFFIKRGGAVHALGAVSHLPELVNPALASITADPAVAARLRVSAAEGLGRLGETDTAISTLTAITTDSEVGGSDRVSAAEGLGRLGETDTAMSTLTAIATDSKVDASNRVSAAEELGRLGETDTAISTLSAIATDPAVYARTRVSAAEELGHLGETDTAIAALRAITTAPAVDVWHRVSAAMRLVYLGETDTGISTLRSVATDPAVDVWHRVSAAGSLGRLGETDAAIASLIAIATNPEVDAGHRLSAAGSLGRLGETDAAIASLIAIATNPEVDAGHRLSAAERSGRLGETDAAIATLSAIAIATDPTAAAKLRMFTPGMLRRLGEDGIAELTAIAKGPGIAEVDRSHVVDALARVVRQPKRSGNSEAAKASLAQLAQDVTVSAGVRGRAAWQLGRLGEVQAAIAALTDLVKDPAAPAMVKVRAAGAIQEFGGSAGEPIAAMRAGIADHEIGIGDRLAMAWRMSDLGERDEGMATLVAVANDETVDDINRVKAAWYLCRLDASDSARPSLNVLTAVAGRETAESGPRFQAGKVLADLGVEETAIAALTAVGHSAEADPEDRIDAAEVLAKLGDKATAETVLQTVADDRSLSNTRREEAHEALRKLNEE